MHISLDLALGRQHLLDAGGNSPLEIAPGAAAAYSLRSLTSSDPNVVRVRRDTGGAAGDNDEQNFTASEISSGALVSFVGSGNDGFVQTWYDQSGNGEDVIQETASTQPRIVESGSLVTGGVSFYTSNVQLMTESNFDFFGANSISVFFVATPFQFSGNPRLLSTRDGTPGFEVHIKNKPKIYYKDSSGNGTGGAGSVDQLFSSGTEFLLTTIVDRDTDQDIKLFLDGSQRAMNSTNLSSAGSVNAGRLSIGAQISGNNRFRGNIEEVIIYASNQESTRVALETNINGHYSIF